MAIKIEKASNAKGKYVKSIIYGKSAVGKTRFSCNGVKKAVILDLENGLGSTEDIDELDRISVSNAYEFAEALDYIEENQDKWDTLIIDSFSQYSDMLYVALLDSYPDQKDSMLLWGTLDKISRQRLEQIIRLKLNVSLIMLEEQVVLDTGFVASYPMYKAKKFKATLESKMSIIAHSQKDKDGVVSFDLTGSNEAVAKNRFLKELDGLSVASDGDIKTFQELLNKIKGE